MTLTISNADSSLLQMLMALNSISKRQYDIVAEDEYPQSLINSIKDDESEIRRQKLDGTLKVYNTVDEAFADLSDLKGKIQFADNYDYKAMRSL